MLAKHLRRFHPITRASRSVRGTMMPANSPELMFEGVEEEEEEGGDGGEGDWEGDTRESQSVVLKLSF